MSNEPTVRAPARTWRLEDLTLDGGGLSTSAQDPPGKFGIAVISPPLDKAGNSVKAQKAIADISNALGGNPYAAKPR